MGYTDIPGVSYAAPTVMTGVPTNTGTGAGGTAAAAGIGAAIGAALFGNNGVLGNGNGSGVTVEKSIGDLAATIPAQTAALQHDLFTMQAAAADRGYQQTIAFNQQASTIDRDVLATGYQTSRQMCDGFNASNVVSLQNKYEAAMQIAQLGFQQEKCCCEEKELILKTSFETQLRDMCNKNDTDKQLSEIKCLITNTDKDQTIRAQAAQLAQMSQLFQTKSITDCIKDAFCKTSTALNTIGENEQVINPLCKWPPFVPSLGCC